ncbi:uncharacterized protein LOC127720809 [Mytilus californianus]|uniref:uncharacterized protein LOC127720809 n=1 Tax=Mytilus californianus TaxID=6549 RepID=UPI00224871E2|nr:uncharacterized protein LOC127720809 [Mytilus californianus]
MPADSLALISWLSGFVKRQFESIGGGRMSGFVKKDDDLQKRRFDSISGGGMSGIVIKGRRGHGKTAIRFYKRRWYKWICQKGRRRQGKTAIRFYKRRWYEWLCQKGRRRHGKTAIRFYKRRWYEWLCQNMAKRRFDSISGGGMSGFVKKNHEDIHKLSATRVGDSLQEDPQIL